MGWTIDKDSPPPDSGNYLVCNKAGCVYVAYYEDGWWDYFEHEYSDTSITHWMLLPEPPPTN